MSVIIKISAVAIIYVCCAIFLKQHRPEYVFLLRVTSIALIIFMLLDEAQIFIQSVNEIFAEYNISSEHLSLLLKVSFIALVSDFIIDTLKDTGETSLAGVISVSSRVLIISLSFPILKSLLVICSNLVKWKRQFQF